MTTIIGGLRGIDTVTNKLLTYDIDLDELLWNMFELAKFPGARLFLDVELLNFDIFITYDLE